MAIAWAGEDCSARNLCLVNSTVPAIASGLAIIVAVTGTVLLIDRKKKRRRVLRKLAELDRSLDLTPGGVRIRW